MATFDGDRGVAVVACRGWSSSAKGSHQVEGHRLPNPWPEEVVSFTDFHEHGFGILASDFLQGFL